MLNIAITGNVASGKSTVAGMLAARGATLIDADQLARDAVAPGTAGLAAIVERFGPAILTADGSLDRTAMRKLVFSDPVARNSLNAIVHPVIQDLRDKALNAARSSGTRLTISDIPLLFEVGQEHSFDGVILVDAPVSVRLARMVGARGLSPLEAQAMIDAQWPVERKRAASRWVIYNGGTFAELEQKVDSLWHELRALQSPDPLPQGAAGVDTTTIAIPHSSGVTVSNIPAELRYTKDHEYIRPTDDIGVVAIGITDFAQGELGDIVYVDLPKVGSTFNTHDVFGSVEAVKAVSELFMPVTGEVIEVNGHLDGEPALINTDPYGDGWMIRVRVAPGGDDGLMSADEYSALVGG